MEEIIDAFHHHVAASVVPVEGSPNLYLFYSRNLTSFYTVRNTDIHVLLVPNLVKATIDFLVESLTTSSLVTIHIEGTTS
jgi:hypothetical protein